MSAGSDLRGWFRGRGRSLGAGLMILAALSVGRVITDRLPKAEDVWEAPRERVGVIGSPVHLRVGDVTVVKVDGAKELSSPTEGKRTTGVWLNADLTVLPADRKSGISYAAVRDSGGHVWELGRGQSTCLSPIAGVPMRCQVVIELPARAIPDAELVLRWSDADLRSDDQAVIPLTLDEATMKRWAATTQPVKVPMAKLGTS